MTESGKPSLAWYKAAVHFHFCCFLPFAARTDSRISQDENGDGQIAREEFESFCIALGEWEHVACTSNCIHVNAKVIRFTIACMRSVPSVSCNVPVHLTHCPCARPAPRHIRDSDWRRFQSCPGPEGWMIARPHRIAVGHGAEGCLAPLQGLMIA